MRGHLIKDARLEAVVGAVTLVAGAWLLRDAYDARGRQQPLWMRPFTFL